MDVIEPTEIFLPALAQPKREIVPALIAQAGPEAVERVIEFFTAEIRNPNTRRAYSRAAHHFCSWMESIPLAEAALRRMQDLALVGPR